ncbi:MAG: glycosyltransferase [Chloroflexota bacterium]
MRLLMMTQAIDLDHPVMGFAHQWVNTLAQHFEHVHVISRLGGRMDMATNVTVHAYAKPSKKDIPHQRHLFFHKKLAKLILGNQVDTVFIHMSPKWVTMSFPYAKLKGLPIALWYTHSAVNGRLKLADKLVNQVFTASKESYRLNSPHLTVMGHGIDINQFLPVDAADKINGRFQIIMPGRLSPAKQPHLLIEAIQQLPRQIQNQICCQFLGTAANDEDFDYEKSLHEQVTAQKLSNVIQFLGAVPYENIIPHYQQADLVINLSKTNSLDKTVLEAMACSVPTLTSNPAFQPILANIEPRLALQHDDLDELMQKITFWVETPAAQRQQVGTELRHEIIKHHNLQHLIANLAKLLKRGRQ